MNTKPQYYCWCSNSFRSVYSTLILVQGLRTPEPLGEYSVPYSAMHSCKWNLNHEQWKLQRLIEAILVPAFYVFTCYPNISGSKAFKRELKTTMSPSWQRRGYCSFASKTSLVVYILLYFARTSIEIMEVASGRKFSRACMFSLNHDWWRDLLSRVKNLQKLNHLRPTWQQRGTGKSMRIHVRSFLRLSQWKRRYWRHLVAIDIDY